MKLKCPSWCPSLESLLSYSTVKIVTINDKRLGLLHYFFMLCILGYIFGYTIMYQQRYLKLQEPFGALRTSLMSPQTRGQLPRAAAMLPYCTQHSESYNGFDNYPCLYWDEDYVLYPTTEATAMFITTRVSITEESLEGCDLTDYTCKFIPVSNTTTYYIADPENFTLMIDHSVYANSIGIQANSEELPGSIVDTKGNTIKDRFVNDSVGVNGKTDVMHLSFLLRAAGIQSLDLPSSHNPDRSMREDGIVLLVFITYSNTYTYNTNKLRYQYSVRQIKEAEFKSEQAIYTKNPASRVIWNRHGVRIIFLQVGELGKFDFQTLLLSFVSGMGLMALATLIVDIIAMRILPGKETYRHYKYLATPKLGVIEHGGDYNNITEIEEEANGETLH